MNGAALLCLPCYDGLKLLETMSPNEPVVFYLFLLDCFTKITTVTFVCTIKRVLGNYALYFLSPINIISC